MPKVSVITTLYNCEKFIDESLKSICEDQLYKDFEIIIVNDGSSDSTWDKVCNKKIKCPAHLINNKDNKKIPTRRNEAISLASGKYIAIHDGDDISMPERLSKQCGFLDNNHDIFCVGSHALKIDEDNNFIGIMDYPALSYSSICSQMLIKKQNPMIDPSTMFRRDDFLKLGKYTLDKSIYTVPDMDLWCRAILSGKKMANLPRALIKYRSNSNGMTQKHKGEMIQAHMTVWNNFYRCYKNNISQIKEV